MIILYKGTNTEEEFNEKPIKDDHPKRHHTYIYWREQPIYYVLLTLPIKQVFDKVRFQCISLVRVVRKNTTWLT